MGLTKKQHFNLLNTNKYEFTNEYGYVFYSNEYCKKHKAQGSSIIISRYFHLPIFDYNGKNHFEV